MSSQEELEGLIRQAKAGNLKPLVLIYGDQDYLVRQAFDRLIDVLVPEDMRSFNLEQLDGTQAEPGQVLDAFNTLPMMAGNKVVGLTEARFFISKSNAAELLLKAKERWAAQERDAAFRQLAKVIGLAEWGWEEAAGASEEQWADALGLKPGEWEKAGGAWVRQAAAEGFGQGLTMSGKGDESGVLAEGLEASLALGAGGPILICVSSSADARKKIYKLFHERGHVLDFKKDAKNGQAAVTARAFFSLAMKQRGLSMKTPVAEAMIGAYGSDLGILERELDKMEAFAFPRKELTDEDRRAVGIPVAQDNVWELLDAMKKKDTGWALKVLRRQIGTEDAAQYQIFGLLSGELRKLVVVRALLDEGLLPSKGIPTSASFKMNEFPKLMKVLPPGLATYLKKGNPAQLFYVLERAKAFSAAQLKDLVAHMAELDRKRVTGGLSSADALEELVLRFCGVREEILL